MLEFVSEIDYQANLFALRFWLLPNKSGHKLASCPFLGRIYFIWPNEYELKARKRYPSPVRPEWRDYCSTCLTIDHGSNTAP